MRNQEKDLRKIIALGHRLALTVVVPGEIIPPSSFTVRMYVPARSTLKFAKYVPSPSSSTLPEEVMPRMDKEAPVIETTKRSSPVVSWFPNLSLAKIVKVE